MNHNPTPNLPSAPVDSDLDARSTTFPPTGDEAPRETVVIRLQPWPRQALLLAAIVCVSVLVTVYILWPTKHDPTGPPVTAASVPEQHEGEQEEHSQEGAIEVDDETAELMGIETEEAAETEIEETTSLTGRVLVDPNSQAIIGAKVSGRVVRVLAEPGQTVRAGQILVVVDSPQVAQLRGELIEARARLKLAEAARSRVAKSESRAAVIQSKSRLDLAETNLGRKKRLGEIGAVAGREVQEAEAEFRNAKAEYDYQSTIQVTRDQQEAEAEVERAKASVARISQSLSSLGTVVDGEGGSIGIASPISGTVVTRTTSVGESVTEEKELMTVMNLSSVIVEAQVPESLVGRVGPGRRLLARAPGVPDGVFEARVLSVGGTVDPAKRTVSIRARVTNTGALLKHEMAVEVQIGSGERKRAITVPVAALVDEDGLKVVYVREGATYERRVVTVGSISYGRAEVLTGVEAGESVVSKSAYQLANMRKGGGEEGGHDDEH